MKTKNKKIKMKEKFRKIVYRKDLNFDEWGYVELNTRNDRSSLNIIDFFHSIVK